eukprot:351152-Chlamydomonas_euryale.AAC.1
MYIGKGGAGNYVKMVHNGIEYGDMQVGGAPCVFVCVCGGGVVDVGVCSMVLCSITEDQWQEGGKSMRPRKPAYQ